MIIVMLGMFAACSLPMRAQEATESSAPKVGLVDDWTYHHLVFSNPGTREDAVKDGTLEKWLKVTNDPRYRMQKVKRSLGTRPLMVDPDLASGTDALSGRKIDPPKGWNPLGSTGTPVKKDWSQSLGSAVAASLTSAIGTLSSSSIGSGSALTVAGGTLGTTGITFQASPPAAATQTGTFAGNPTNGQTAKITNGSSSLTLLASYPSASQTGTFNSPPAASSAITVVNGANTLTLKTNAITASYSLLFTGAATSTGTVTITYSGGTSSNKLVITAVTSGTNGCSAATTGTFVTSTSSATRATNFNSAIAACYSSYPAIGITPSYTANSSTVTLTAVLPGNFLTVSKTLTNSTLSTATTGSNGSRTCTSSTTGTYVTSNSTTTLASNLVAAINACNTAYPAAVGVTSTSATNKVTVTASTPGPSGNSIGLNSTSGFFAWNGSTLTGGTPINTGTNFAIDGSNADAASNLAAAINRYGSTVGVGATSSAATVTVTASAPGTSGNSIALASTLTSTSFSWAGTKLAGGTNGVTSGTTTPPTFAYWSGATYVSSATLATNIATAVNANTTVKAVLTATANSPATGNVTFAAKTVGAGGNSYSVTSSSFSAFSPANGNLSGGVTPRVQPNAAPAMYGPSLSTADCTNDFVVYPTGQAGATGAANIIAYNNLYAGCSSTGPVPSVYWAYNTGAGQSVTTSPVLSADGTQVAFIQSNGTTASLVVLTWAAGEGTSITSPVTPSNMHSVAFADGNNDSISAPYYDSASDDALYVGDDSGYLHKFTGVFEGTPTESGSPWPVKLSTGTAYKVSTPVYDPTSGYVFVGDLGGTLYSVGSGTVKTTAGAIHGSAKIGDAIADAPLVDSSKGAVYAFVTTNGSGYNAIYDFGTGFTSSSTPEFVTVGTGGTGYYLYTGMFDNVWYQSTDDTGNLYVVGNTGGAASGGATLYRVGISNGSLATTSGAVAPAVAVVTGLTTSGASPYPSPLTEFCNGTCNASATQTTSGTDYVFFSVNQGAKTGCTTSAGHGCILSYNVSNPAKVVLAGSGLPVTTPASPGCWATGGIVIDNYDTVMTGASQIYFVNLNGAVAGGPSGATSSACAAGTSPTINAVQASQSNP
jgi:hypothetical protein